jgi:hypothetical protein
VDDARVSSWRRCHAGIYWAATPSHVEVDVDGLTCPLYHPMVWGHHTRGQSLLSDVALSHRITVGGGAFLGGTKPPGLDI